MSTTGPDKKPVRRVRVIEILDGEDLDEATIEAVLAADDAAAAEGAEPKKAKGTGGSPEPSDAGDAADTGAGKSGESGKPGKSGKKDEAAPPEDDDTDDETAADATGEASDEASDDADGGAADGAEERPAAKKAAKKKEGPGARRLPVPGPGGRSGMLLTAGIVVLALLAGFALFQWRSAASSAGERAAIVDRVSAFGDVMATYSYDDIDSSNEKAMGFLTGDALAERKKVDLAALREQLESQRTKLESTTYAVYVGSVDGSLASAVLVFDLRGESSSLEEPQTISKSHLTLGLIKRDGEWMISSMVPAGSESASTSGTSVSPVPGGDPDGDPTPSPTERTEKDEKN